MNKKRAHKSPPPPDWTLDSPAPRRESVNPVRGSVSGSDVEVDVRLERFLKLGADLGRVLAEREQDLRNVQDSIIPGLARVRYGSGLLSSVRSSGTWVATEALVLTHLQEPTSLDRVQDARRDDGRVVSARNDKACVCKESFMSTRLQSFVPEV